MCGFFGIIDQLSRHQPDQEKLKQSAAALEHRGPDSNGVCSAPGFGFAHTRLSLLDPRTRSDQPMWDPTSRYCILFNGEIYNYRDLRREHTEEGVNFLTTGDTEVLLSSLIHWGVPATMMRLEGMFSFAFYDSVNRSITLGRDRFGTKPLYYSLSEGALLFSSEVSAMLPWRDIKLDLGMSSAFLNGFPGPTRHRTLFDGIEILAPGCTLRLSPNTSPEVSEVLRMSELWDPQQAEWLSGKTDTQIVDALDESLVDSVNSQLLADAPVGGLCSGGVDSSLILAIAARQHANLIVFHANVVGPNSEFAAAKKVADLLKLDFHSIEVGDRDFIDEFPNVVLHNSGPFFHTPLSIPFLRVARLARQEGVKAVISGEGADECFIGYDWSSFSPTSSDSIMTNARSLLKLLPRRRVRQFIPKFSSFGYTDPVAALHSGFEVTEEADSLRNSLMQVGAGRYGDFRNVVVLDSLNYNLRSLLHRNDAMGMAASVESRFPFLDTSLVRFAVNMPYDKKIRFSNPVRAGRQGLIVNKWALRKLADRYLPKYLSRREKQPFRVDSFTRFRIDERYFVNAPVLDLLRITYAQLCHFQRIARPRQFLRLLHLDVTTRLFVSKEPLSTVQADMQRFISVDRH